MSRFFFGLLSLVFALTACAPAPQQAASDQHQADVHYRLAIAHFQADNPTLALKELLTAVDYNPRDSEIQVALAQAYQAKKAYALAEVHYLKALQLSPENPRYQNNLGALYLDMARWDQAIDYFGRAAGNLLFMNTHIALAGKAYAYYRKGDYEQALSCFAEAIATAPGYAPAYYLRSEVYRTLYQAEQEEGSLRQAIDLAPDYLKARYRLAQIMIDKNHHKEAREQLAAIIASAPSSDWGVRANDLMRSLPAP